MCHITWIRKFLLKVSRVCVRVCVRVHDVDDVNDVDSDGIVTLSPRCCLNLLRM